MTVRKWLSPCTPIGIMLSPMELLEKLVALEALPHDLSLPERLDVAEAEFEGAVSFCLP
jgi:hypothetical protein